MEVEETWKCPLCRRIIRGKHSIARHQINFWTKKCINTTSGVTAPAPGAVIAPAPGAGSAPTPVAGAAPVPVAGAAVVEAVPVAGATVVEASVGMHELARRNTNPLHQQQQERARYVILQGFCDQGLQHSRNSRDFLRVQHNWDVYIQKVKQLCSDEFWKVFLSMHRHSGAFIDCALAGVRRAFKPDVGQFPVRRSRLIASIRSIPSFWSSVMHTFNVDLSHFRDLQTKSLTFKFVDPIWAWLFLAARMDPLDLH